ncbi:beta-galactosidase [Duganella radicis]|uniref:Beta-galactosidase n=1 Tax=Duganella radicis TaxID=551988 RepID=A0A6L6PE32_9BURK|nr:beta-galactosidase [Duganella radicis]MTV37173.1 cellulase family glycosylhydrolase [Duganella radicis]
MRPIHKRLRQYACGAGLALAAFNSAAAQLPDTILYGVAYYSEYTPVDRVDEDARMMKEAGINVVRIAESTWGTLEKSEGVFDFSHVDRMLTAFHQAGIKVIIGTPTYAVPTWLARQHPDVLVTTPNGRAEYGRRQNMDITNAEFRRAAERVIVKLVEHVKDHPAVIGYQVDNETKAYFTSGPNVQAAFVASMRKKFPDLDALNRAFGLDYWSNRINDWADFPSTNGSINASLSNAFAQFQRELVTEYLTWQADLVRAHARKDQFITQNFDLGWKDHSFGVQPEVDHWEAAKPLDVAGIDIYHPSQDKLTGAEIAFGGDLTRSMRNGQNYLVLETEAQGFPQWTPYPGQLRLQAFSHLASGANMVGYWHWATTANAIETYWRGVLSQDYQPNEVYAEVKTIGADLKRLGPALVDMKKTNKVAFYVSNIAQAGFDAFKIQVDGKSLSYNEAMRPYYDALYRMNVEVDILSPSSTKPLSDYKLIVVPSLYAASDAEIARLNDYAKAGGHLLYTFRSGFSDENTKVRYAVQPGAISEAAGVRYHQFTTPLDVTLDGDPFGVGKADNQARWWMEFVTPTTAQVVARYKHPSWPAYAAVTRNNYGRGEVSYVGFMPTDAIIGKLLADQVKRAGLDLPKASFPLIVRGGTLNNGHDVRYLLNYSAKQQTIRYEYPDGTELLSGKRVGRGQALTIKPWGVAIVEELKP